MFRPKLLLIGALAAAVAIAASAAATVVGDAAAPAASAAKAPPVPLLWKVSDADNEIYLLGSFHLLHPEDYPLSKDVDDAFADAEALMFELSPKEMASPELGMLMGRAALRSDGTRLDSDLTPEQTRKLEAWGQANAGELQKVGMQPQMLQLFEPWFVALMISLTEMTKMGLNPELGLDKHLADRAVAADKPAEGLETGAEQVAFLDGMDKTEQLQSLDEAIQESDNAREDSRKLHDAWRNGDADFLWREMALQLRSDYPRLYQRINVARNDAWVPKIEARLKQPGKDDTLVVVGALHLLGEDGVVEKLRARGYKVDRLCSACAKPKRKSR
jgi:uncharacterized protein